VIGDESEGGDCDEVRVWLITASEFDPESSQRIPIFF